MPAAPGPLPVPVGAPPDVTPPLDRAGHQLCALFLHAHPDDEASKGAGTMARLAAEGVRVVLVTCTGGEAGEVLNAAADTPEVRADLPAVRRQELEASAAILGVSTIHQLGYRDSGMPDSDDNHRPDNLWNAPPDEALERLVRIVRAERPQVVVTYADEHARYPHPDHIRTHELGVAVFDAAADPGAFPRSGTPWAPSKLYYQGFWSRPRFEVMHGWFIERGEESPFQRFVDRIDQADDVPFTTRIDIAPWIPARRAALLAHRTQVAPDSFWMRMPDEALAERYPFEEFVLARSRVDGGRAHEPAETGLAPSRSDTDLARSRAETGADGEWESDLFAGVRAESPGR